MPSKPRAKRTKRVARKTTARRRRPINLLASILTLCNLYCGVASVFAAINGDFSLAAYWILAGIVFDILDGTAARMTNSVSDFGKELDSLSDIATFGMAPSILLYIAYLYEDPAIGPIGSLVAVVYVVCGALRLARYNSYQADRTDVFFGLPIPGAAGTIASFVLFANYFEWEVAFWVLSPMTVALSLLMVTSIEYPKHKVKQFLLAPRVAFRHLVAFVAGIAVFHYARQYHPSIVLFPMGATYVVYGVVNDVYRRVKGLRTVDGLPDDDTGDASKVPAGSGTETAG